MEKWAFLFEVLFPDHPPGQFDNRDPLLQTLADFPVHQRWFTQHQARKRNTPLSAANSPEIAPGSIHLETHRVIEDAFRREEECRASDEGGCAQHQCCLHKQHHDEHDSSHQQRQGRGVQDDKPEHHGSQREQTEPPERQEKRHHSIPSRRRKAKYLGERERGNLDRPPLLTPSSLGQKRLSLLSDLYLIRIKAQRLVVGGQRFFGPSRFSQNHSPIAVGLYMRRVKSQGLLKGREGFLPSSQAGQSQTLIMSDLSILGKSSVKL